MKINSCNNTSFSGIRVVMNNREQKNLTKAMGTIRGINAIFKLYIIIYARILDMLIDYIKNCNSKRN